MGRIQYLLQPAVPSAQVRLRLPGGEQVELHGLHPEPPWPGDDSGERDAGRLRQIMKDVLASEPLAEVQYVSCADYETLEEMEIVKRKALLSMAVFVGKTRLIDNLVLE